MKIVNIDSFFNTIGFGFPETEEELDSFDNNYSHYEIKSKIGPPLIETKTNKKDSSINLKPNGVDFHKRTVLAAEIVFQLKDEWTLGHLKLQKIIFLCQNVNNMAIHTNFLKQAMGPYDPRLMRSIDKQLKENKWFEFNQGDNFPKYKLLEKAGGHKEWYERYFESNKEGIQKIIELFRKTKTKEIELIATIFACWKEIIEKNEILSENLIIKRFYEWSDLKSKFSESEILSAIVWMKDKDLFPIQNK